MNRRKCILVAVCAGAVMPWLLSDAGAATSADTKDLRGADALPDGLAPSDWSAIRSAYDEHRHAAYPTDDGGYQARNPGQQWLTRFDAGGFSTRPDAGGWEWGLELRSYGFAGQERVVAGPPKITTAAQRVTYARDELLEEWFVNDQRGLEHGFTVKGRPARTSPDSSTALTFLLAVRGGLRPELSTDELAIRFVDEHGRATINYSGLKVWDADGKALPARFEPAADGVRLTVDESGARYPITIDPVAQQAYLKPSNTDIDDNFGASVAISGDTVVVGAIKEDSSATGVNGNQADNSAVDSGAAYVFVRSGGGWTQQAYLKASNAEVNDQFGKSVAVSGDTIVVGASLEDGGATGVNGDQSDDTREGSGAAYVFVRSGGSWTQQAYLKASNTGQNDLFGDAVATTGDTVIVGAKNESSAASGVNGNQADNSKTAAGAAYIFVRSGTTWTQQAYLKASNPDAYDLFAAELAISGDTLVVGAPEEDSNSAGINGNGSNNTMLAAGAAYVFIRTDGAWAQQAYLKASNPDVFNFFGTSVAISGDTLVVGASGENSNATGVNGDQANNSAADAGAAYVFVRTGTNWAQQAYLKASNTEKEDYFGSSVAISGDAVIIGASGESSSADGINGDQSNNNEGGSGAAYFFTRSGGTWAQQAYLKASNGFTKDFFAESAAISGDTAVVGAIYEDGSASGVNGDHNTRNAKDAGAAYIFNGLGDPAQSGPNFVVNTLADENDGLCGVGDCSLAEALGAANADADQNTVTFAPGLSGTIVNSRPEGLLIRHQVIISGPGARTLTISGNGSARLFQVAPGSGIVVIAGLTLANGRAGGTSFPANVGGAILSFGNVSLLNCALVKNSASVHGGAIYSIPPDAIGGFVGLALQNCTFSENAAGASGGAIFQGGYRAGAFAAAENCTFHKNSAGEYGGAIYSDGTIYGIAELRLTDCTFNQNTAGILAGGIYIDATNPDSSGSAKLTLRNTILRTGASGANLRNDGGTIVSEGHNISNDSALGSLTATGDRPNTDPRLADLQNNGGPTDTVALLSDSPAIDTGDNANTPESDQRGFGRVGVNDIGAFEFNGLPPVAPTVTTSAATEIGTTSATLHASVNPNGYPTTFQFTSDFRTFEVQNVGSGTAAIPLSITVTGLKPGTQYRFNAVATNANGTTQGVEQTFTTLARTRFANIATRLRVETGENVLIGGFIVTGTQPKRFIVRAVGPTLGVEGALQNPQLELYRGDELLAGNDNWRDAPNQQEIIDSTVAPPNDLESAVLTTLEPGAYTAVVSGVDGQTGVGSVEAYDLDASADSTFSNISTRGFVQTGADAMFGGLIITGSSPQKVILRAIGPSLGIAAQLEDPVLELYDTEGNLLTANDNWRDTQQAEVEATTIPPSNDLESAIVATLPPAAYTAIVRGVNDTTGVALVEVYALQ